VNYWTFRAARHVLKSVDLMYVSTTDYMMHTYAPDAEQSLAHLHQLDRLLGNIVDDHPKLELYLTADHGMNAKTTVLDPTRILAAAGIRGESVASVKDKHKVHHQDLGGCCYVYLDRPSDLRPAMEILRAARGIEEVHDGSAAAKQFHLRRDRIGDIVLLAAKDVAFGDLSVVKPDTKVRSHGSRHEQPVPLLIYGRKAAADALEYNLDLTRKLVLGDSVRESP
jgi:phosphonoacetate hydrolase